MKSRKRRDINGVLLLDKPIGITSNAALQKTRWIYKAAKAGHTGCLDPLATGVLPICFGEATKFSNLLLESDKTYEVKARFGLVTDTGDLDGQVLKNEPAPPLQEDDILHVLNMFKGAILQVPSMFSALKHNGVPLYKLARQGIEIERKARPIFIYSIDFIGYDNDELTLVVKCSKGTYIRTLIEDIGKQLGCGACVTHLRRIQTGCFNIENTVSLDKLESILESGDDNYIDVLDGLLMDFSCLVSGISRLELNDEHAYSLLKGKSLYMPGAIDTGVDEVSLWHNKIGFLGIGRVVDVEQGKVSPKRLISTSV